MLLLLFVLSQLLVDVGDGEVLCHVLLLDYGVALKSFNFALSVGPYFQLNRCCAFPRGCHLGSKSGTVTDFRKFPLSRREGRKKKEALSEEGAGKSQCLLLKEQTR